MGIEQKNLPVRTWGWKWRHPGLVLLLEKSQKAWEKGNLWGSENMNVLGNGSTCIYNFCVV